MKPEEIVQALRCSATRKEKEKCEMRRKNELGCFRCFSRGQSEAASLIEQMTAENVVLPDGQASAIESLRKELEWKDMVIALAQKKQTEAEAERDAAIADLKICSRCATCKYHCGKGFTCDDCAKKKKCKCMDCRLGRTNWEWRGLPEVPEEGEHHEPET